MLNKQDPIQSTAKSDHGIELIDVKKSYTLGPLRADAPLAVKGFPPAERNVSLVFQSYVVI